MANDDTYKSARDFLAKMDAGDFDGNLAHELHQLSKEQLENIAKTLMERGDTPRKPKRLPSDP